MRAHTWIVFAALLFVVVIQAADCRTTVKVNWQEGKLEIQTDEAEPGGILAKTLRARDLNPGIAVRVWEKAQNLRVDPSKKLGDFFAGYEDFCDRFRRSDIILHFIGPQDDMQRFDLGIYGPQGVLATLNIAPATPFVRSSIELAAEFLLPMESMPEQTLPSEIPAITSQESQLAPSHVGPTLPLPAKQVEDKSEARATKQHTGIIIDCSQFLFPRVKYIRLLNEHGMAFHDRTNVDLLAAHNLGMADYASSLKEALANGRAGINPLILTAVKVGIPRKEDIVLQNKDAKSLMQDAHLQDCLYQGSLVIVTGDEF